MKEVQEVYMGVALQAGLGQDPARQAALFSGLSGDKFFHALPCLHKLLNHE